MIAFWPTESALRPNQRRPPYALPPRRTTAPNRTPSDQISDLQRQNGSSRVRAQQWILQAEPSGCLRSAPSPRAAAPPAVFMATSGARSVKLNGMTKAPSGRLLAVDGHLSGGKTAGLPASPSVTAAPLTAALLLR
jgi:hypothetical protein